MRFATNPTPNRQGPASQATAPFAPLYPAPSPPGAFAPKLARARAAMA